MNSWPSYAGDRPWADDIAALATVQDPGPLTKGVPNPERPEHWLVTPWPQSASYSVVVGHFLRWHPWDTDNAEVRLRYYQALQAALEVAPTHDLIYACDRSWQQEMQRCITRCITSYQAERETQRQRSTLRTTTSRSAGQPGQRQRSATVRPLRPVHGFRDTGS